MALRALDANVILRAVLSDHATQSPQCQRLIDKVEAGSERVFLPEVSLCDVVFILRSFYKFPAERIQEVLGQMLSLDGIVMKDKSSAQGALLLSALHNVDFSDALMTAQLAAEQVNEIYSYDKHFDRLKQVKRIEPK